MVLVAEISTSEKVEFNGLKMVKIQGKLNGYGLFETFVKEDLIPDNLEGKTCIFEYEIKLVKFKPTLKLKRISLNPLEIDNALEELMKNEN